MTKDEDREWWATSGGWFLTVALGWLAFSSVVLYSPQALDWLDSRISAAVTALTGFMGFAAARAGNSPKTPTDLQDPGNVNNGGGAARLLKRYGPQVLMASFMLLLVMLLSGLNQRILIMFGFPAGPSLWRFVAPVVWMALMTISGAAASPNMGYHSSPLLMLVMTLFNARLGWWLGNPRCKRRIWTSPSPRWGIRPFLDEAFGLTADTNSWIYLSDGGHFENLAIFEMVLRRCHCIVVSDAGCDPHYTYEDLANAVRKIRIDFGIPIDFDNPSMPMSADKLPTPRHSGKHCAIARIRYSAVDGPKAPDGILIYIKPSLNGNDPADVQHYAAADPLFPHQPTSDQFFDESQFESYRRLGLHVIEEIMHAPDRSAYEYTFSEFLRAAEAYANNT